MKSISAALRLSSAAFQCRYQSSRIVVGLSATSYGDLALQQAVRMSKDGDIITGIFVPPELKGTAFPPNVYQVMKEKQTAQLKEVNERASKVAAEAFKKYGSKAKFETKELTPNANRRRAIVDACWDLKADVLVLGSLGASAEKAKVEEEKIPYDEQRYQSYYTAVATIPDYAMHNAPCPVFVVKPKTTQ